MNVLSLCDGMSCARIALAELGIKVDKYYASEIDKNSISATTYNFPDTIEIGDVKNITESFLSQLPKIDLVCYGSPCRSLSKATIAHDGYHDGLKGISGLFYDCTKILKWIQKNNNPDVWFLVENVDSDNKKDLGLMSDALGVLPILINSGNFSAQNRLRNYWTNLKVDIGALPENDEVLKDVMQPVDEIADKYWYSQSFSEPDMSKAVCCLIDLNGHDILKRVQNPAFKCPTLTSCRGGNTQKKVLQNGRVRKLTPTEYMRLQGIPEWYKIPLADSHIYNMCGDGWNIPTIKFLFSQLKEY